MEDSVKLPKNFKEFNYDQWLDYFRGLPISSLNAMDRDLKQVIPTEGYAALKRWLEIIESPSKMDKLYQGRLKAQQDEDVMELAVGDNDEAFYEALIRENVTQLNSGNVSPQEVARLSQNINIFRKELREIRSRRPNKNTKLAKVLKEIEEPKNQGSESDSNAKTESKMINKSSGGKDA